MYFGHKHFRQSAGPLQPAVFMRFPSRKSADIQVCPPDKSLLNICNSSDMVTVNGRAKDDEAGASTCKIRKGTSVMDYFITSSPPSGISRTNDCAGALLGIQSLTADTDAGSRS